MVRRYEREKKWTVRATVVKRLAAVAAACLLLRAAADRIEGRPARTVALPEEAGALALMTELPQAPWEGPDLGMLALRWELPGAVRLTGADTPEEPPVETPDPPEEPPGQEPDRSPPVPAEPEVDDEPEKGGEAQPDDAVSTTITGAGGGYELTSEGIYIKNGTDYDIDVDALLNAPLNFSAAEGAKVLIIHTHGSEAYMPAGDDIYEPSDPSRTEDKNYNVVRVGDELERALTEQGIPVIHDRELYDYPSYTGSYNRSLEAIQRYLAADPDIKVVVDLHRDALVAADGTVYKTVADIGDTPSAQVMLVMGTDFSGLNHPEWKENLSFALKIQAQMAVRYPTLARPLNINQYRYNQHATTGSMIAEIGTNGNTLQEALTAVRYFAECLAAVLLA